MTGIRSVILNKWVNEYKNKGIDGLMPLDWQGPTPEAWQLIQERRAALGDDVSRVDFSKADIMNIKDRNGWSLQKSRRWAVRFRECGILALSPAKHPKSKKQKLKVGNSLGAVPEEALNIAVERKEIIKPLLEVSKDITKEVKVLSKQCRKSERTLWDWLHKYRLAGIRGLAPQKRADNGTFRGISDTMVTAIISIRLANAGWRARRVYDETCEHARAIGELHPSLKQVRAVIKSISPGTLAIADGRLGQFKNKYEFTAPIPRTDNRVVWQIDTTVVPVLLHDLRNKEIRNQSGTVRCYLISVMDTRSRLSVANTLWYDQPDRFAVASTIRDAILDWGIPHALETDRGRDYMAAHVTGLLEELGTQVSHLPPHQPQLKGKIERFFWTLETRLWSCQKGYTGSNVVERSDNLRASLNISDLEKILQRFIGQYNKEIHSTTGRTPSEMYGDVGTESANARRLDFLLMEPSQRIVSKGEISYLGITYRSADLEPLTGKSVLVRGRPTYEKPYFIEVFYNEEWVCTAYDTDALNREEVRQAKRNQKNRIHERIKGAKEHYSKIQPSGQNTEASKPSNSSQVPTRKRLLKRKHSKRQSVLKKMIRGANQDQEKP